MTTTNETPKTQTVLEEISAQVAQEMQSEFERVTKEHAGNMPAMIAALGTVQAQVAATAKERHSVLVKEVAAKREAQQAVADVFGGLLLDSFKASLAVVQPDTQVDGKTVKGESLQAMAEKLDTVPSIIIRMDRADAGKGKFGAPTIVLGKVTQLGTGSSGTRNHRLTVNGTEHASVSIAWKAVMQDTPQPSEVVGGKESKTRKVAIAALKEAGHTVLD